MRVRHAANLLILLAATVLPAFGQYRTAGRASFNIDGNARDELSQRPMENIRVDLKQASGNHVNNTFTDDVGDFEFAGLPNGNYVIEIAVKGYEPVRQNIEIRNQSRDALIISMSKTAEIVDPTSSVTISAHQLSVPHKAHDEYEKGVDLLYGKSDYQGAIVELERAIKEYPTYYEAYADIGNAYLRLRQMAPAEEALRKSVDLSSGRYAEALVILAGLLSNTERYEDAVPFARKIVEVDPSSWHGPFELARALYGLNQLQEAEKNAVRARDLNPADAPVYLMLANIHMHLQDYPALLNDLDSYLKLEPAGPEADQARTLRDDLQARQKEADDQAKSNRQGREPGNTASPGSGDDTLEPDASGLPSLPPPAQSEP